MALIDCPKCGKQVSSFAPACPDCGCAANAIRGGDIVEKPVDDEPVAFSLSAAEETLLFEMGMRNVKMILAAEEIEFRDASIFGGAESVYLRYSQVENFRFVERRREVEKNKSVVGRAVVGGLLFGPLGAVVGGISGTGKKVSENIKNFLVIDYISQGGEKRSLSLGCDAFWPSTREKLSKLLKERCPNILSSNRL